MQAENCAAAAEVRRPYLSRTHPSLKKEKNIKNYYYNNYTTILSGERYLAKNAKKQVRFLHTKHSTKYLCLKKLKKNLSQDDEHEDRRNNASASKKNMFFALLLLLP